MRVASCAAVLLAVSGGFAGTAMASGQTGWVESGGELYWYDNGVMARDKQVYDPASDAWYWFDADGTMARDKDVFIPVSNDDRTQGKWVRYDSEGHMVKGEDYRYGAWYYFDPVTGEMAKGFVYLESGQRWVFYDYATGRMLYGEQAIDGAWYYLDSSTGAVTYGWHLFSDSGRLVYYAPPSGAMVHGAVNISGTVYHFDELTGALSDGQQPPSAELPQSMVSPLSLGALTMGGQVRSVRILGDSIMAGMGAPDYAPGTGNLLFTYNGRSYYEPRSDFDCASNRLRSTLAARGVETVNASVPGLGSMRFYNMVGDAVLGDEDAAVVVLGTNDRGVFDPTEDLAAFRVNAEQFLSRVAAHYGGNMIVLASMPVEQETYNFTLREVSDTLRDICVSHGWSFASLYDSFTYVANAKGISALGLYTDGTHPNRYGQDVLWSALGQALGLITPVEANQIPQSEG